MAFDKAFEPAEFQRRVGLVKTRMQKAGFDLLDLPGSGQHGVAHRLRRLVVLHPRRPSWFTPRKTSRYGSAERKMPNQPTSPPTCQSKTLSVSPNRWCITRPSTRSMSYVISSSPVAGAQLVSASISIAHYYTARAHQHLVSGLPNARISDNAELVNWARLVKSPAELAYMREAGRTVTEVMNKALANLRPGVRQHEVIADVYRDQITGHEGNYGDYTSLCPLIQVGEGTGTPHLTWTDEPLPESGLIVMELAAARRHYHAPLTRTAHIGTPPAEMAKLADVIVEGGDRAIEAAQTGVICEEVEAVWQAVLNRNGYEKRSRVGYSIGLNYPPDWGERTASLRAGDKTVLEAGMCFHFQSGVWLEDFGAAISESIVITEKGGERLCDVARELVILEAHASRHREICP